MVKAAIYMRVSTDRQAQEGDSIPAQRTALRKYIADHDNMIFAGEYLDDGISGTKNDRDELQRMLSDVREGNINLILCTKMDRLHRSLRNFLNMQDILDRYNCNWLAIWEPMYDTSTPQGRMIVNVMMNLAQFEAEQTGQRIKQVLDYKVSKGEVVSGSQPVGYSIEGKRLVPNADADIVRQVFEFYSRHGNLDMTIREFAHFGKFPLSAPGFKAMLRNTKYIGEFRGNAEYCEPIIDKSLFESVQRNLGMNIKKSQKYTYIFTGMLKCAECGAVLAGGVYKKKRAHDFLYLKRYRCPLHYNAVPRCGNGHHLYEQTLEKFLVATVREQLNGIAYSWEIEEDKAQDNSARIAAVDRKITRLKELYINDLISLEEYKADKEDLETEKAALITQDTPERNLSGVREFLKLPFEEMYPEFTDSQKRYLWRSIIREIKFSDSKHLNIDYIE